MIATGNIRVACLGAGYFSQFHYESWARLERVTLAGSCDNDIAKARATGHPAYGDLSAMIDAVDPDILDIIVPPASHAAAIRTAIQAGVKYLICQKPFCQSLDEARAIVNEADAAGVTLLVHENFRFQPWYRTIRAALGDGLIGEVLQATFRLRPGDGQGENAYLDRQPYFQRMERFLVHETAVHWIDTFRFLLGDPTAVYADLRKVNPVIAGEDAGYIVFDYANGVRALFDGNRSLDHASDNPRRTMGEGLFEGTEGAITLLGDGSVRLRKFRATEDSVLLAANNDPGFGGDCVHALQRHVIAGLLDGAPLENRAGDYMKVLEIEGAVYRSAGSGAKIVL